MSERPGHAGKDMLIGLGGEALLYYREWEYPQHEKTVAFTACLDRAKKYYLWREASDAKAFLEETFGLDNLYLITWDDALKEGSDG